MDKTLFRGLMGRFATGVTVITTSQNGEHHGMTANAFSSLSMDPPLLLVCIDKGNRTYKKLQETGHFVVNFLSEDQQDISDRFAGRFKGEDPWADLDFQISDETGSPILAGTLGYADCKLESVLDGGDHGIFVGRLVDGGLNEAERPLLFYASRYRRLPEE